jgi:uncharacterized protein YndB with AHSA1/START domain
MSPDKIEKHIVLRAPLTRVWDAISDSQKFGSWFGVAFNGPFVAGSHVTGKIRPTTVDSEVARLQAPHQDKPFDFYVEAIEPKRRISFRWHPFAIDPEIDYSNEPTTLIVFELAEVGGETSLTITESGFDQIPLERRAKAFAANDGGWTMQTTLISKYVSTEVAS